MPHAATWGGSEVLMNQLLIKESQGKDTTEREIAQVVKG